MVAGEEGVGEDGEGGEAGAGEEGFGGAWPVVC